MDYYCVTCDKPVCDRCVIMGSEHRGHEIVQLADANAATLSKLSTVQSEIQRRVDATETLVRPACGRAEAVYEGLGTRVDEAADDAVAYIERLRRQAKAQLSSHKVKEFAHLSRNVQVMREAAEGVAKVLAELPRGSRQASNPMRQRRLVEEWQQALTHGSMQVPEWDAARVADFLQGLSSFSTLQGASLSSLSVQVFVSMSGRSTITASVGPTDTAADVKALVKRHTGFPVERQCLYLGGKPLDDELPVGAQGVTKHTTLELRLRASAEPKDVKEWQKQERLELVKMHAGHECTARECTVLEFFANPRGAKIGRTITDCVRAKPVRAQRVTDAHVRSAVKVLVHEGYLYSTSKDDDDDDKKLYMYNEGRPRTSD